MGKRKVTILDTAADAVAEVAFFVEAKGMPQTAKKFVTEAFDFFESLSDERMEHRQCSYPLWKSLNYRCVSYRKYTVAYLYFSNEIVICEFVPSKLLHW
ncbi:MAG: hypothetical protein KGZ74_04990 [Chitinophagaceae bacterium]|nr:hypothetical protein [Chitinophagaceae bacterium]